MKKGFTLVELLAVLIILSVVSVLVFPNVIKIINESKENLYQTQLRDIENVTKTFALEHSELLDSDHLNIVYITLDALKKGKYLEIDKINNPKTGEEMNGCVKIIYNDDNSQYNYIYEEIDCVNDSSLSGYIITYQDDFKREERNLLISAYDKILSDYNGTISMVGGETSGLYDIDDQYIFRGDSPNNYVKLGTGLEKYRIISLDKENKTIKLIKVSPSTGEYSKNNSNVFIESHVATTILLEYYTEYLDNFANKLVDTEKWKNGKLDISKGVKYDILKSIEATSTVSNRLGLINISDYVIASLNNECYQNFNSDTCSNSNYLADLFGSNYVWTMDSSNTGQVITIENKKITDHTLSSSDITYNTYPVIVLKTNVTITSGNGTSSNSYIFN